MVVEMIIEKINSKGITLEKVFSTICFLAGLAFMIAAIMGLWRHFFTMGLCFCIGVMISDEEKPKEKNKRRDNR